MSPRRPEPGLDQTGDPAALIVADLPAVATMAGKLETLGGALERTARGLRGIEVGQWSGDAADAFRARFDESPRAWFTGADAFADAAGACRRFAGAVGQARQQAGEAAELYRQGVAASDAAVRERNATVFDASAPPPTFVDPGVPMVEQAVALLSQARAARDAAGSDAARAVASAAASAPDPPSGWSRAAVEASDLLSDVGRVLPGIGEGVEDIYRAARMLNPIDPWNVTHPASYVDGVSSTAAGLVQANLHPSELVKGAVGTGWGSDPGHAAGKLLPGLALSVATGGSGKIATTVAERSAARAIRKVRPPAKTETAPELPVRASMDPRFRGEERGEAEGLAKPHNVRYLSDKALERHRLTVHDGLLYDGRGRPFHSAPGGSVWSESEDRSIFVVDDKGNLYASNEQEKGALHHSSFLSGGPVAGAGEIGVVNGKVTFLSDRSGHYSPPADCITQAIRYLYHQEGLNIDGGTLQRWGE
ncbi:WXG100 family type VII secretion target [Pseudonocardia endophytica]|uniref:WXG100 family type VII secretion target n=1 Tax=Pseudonocardia endophytica TaxID=401976 RepID=UPI00104A9EA0|nr:hypothetical protein [Pseudonocardia endophytica]